MTKSRLRNNYLKNRNDTNRLLYNKQRNYCVTFKENQKEMYDNVMKGMLLIKKTFLKMSKALPLKQAYDK